MINKISVKNIACFCDEGVQIDELSKINFLYGANATGKTTISNVINNPENYTNSNIEWENEESLKTLVYNDDFLEENIFEPDQIKGVFTLGEESTEKRQKIEDKNQKIDELRDNNLKDTLGDKKDERNKNAKIFNDKCWKLKNKYDEYFKQAFLGSLGSKEQFKQKILEEINTNNSELEELEDLKEEAKTIFNSGDMKKYDKIPTIEFNGLHDIEDSSIYSKKIIGKDDIDIANMIKELDNSDWVREGINYYEQNNGYCPFCQQEVNYDLKDKLEDYFDESFKKKIEELSERLKGYKSKVADINSQVSSLYNNEEKFIEHNSIDFEWDTVKEKKSLIDEIISNNIDRIKNKLDNPTKIIEIKSIIPEIKKVNEVIKETNEQIESHNQIVDNLDKEKEKLENKIWKFIISEIEQDYNQYKEKKDNLSKAIKNISNKLQEKNENIEELSEDITELENKIISVNPTKKKINNLLDSWGFSNFKLEESQKKGFYKIVRHNGEKAKKTLSEGEKTFISFLYFYFLIKGSINENRITNDRVVVFDDPISSLDSNVLFIVSNLIRNLIKEIRNNDSNIKQIFVFTHNIHFHKEVSYTSNHSNNHKDTTFQILRKEEDISTIREYDKNPIKTTYELLWKEVKEAKNSECVNVTIQNTLRRIIEYYFKILGDIKYQELIEEFEGEEKRICDSLISWVNEGSHTINNDLHIDTSYQVQDKYIKVFKKIFKKSGHPEHYNMMIGQE